VTPETQLPAAPADPAGPFDPAEEAAWAELCARWGDPEAHRAFLSRFADLPGLARAGARYRGVLAVRPDDSAALRGRDEVLRRATVVGLASMPRTPPPPAASPWMRRGVIATLALGAAAALAFVLLQLVRSGVGR
jgi:hypothetical protein